MKREESLLNLICFIAAAGFFALIAYNIFAGGSIISTDGLFFIVVPLVFALSFLAVPGMEFLERMLAKRKGRTSAPQLATAGGGSTAALPGQRTPALKDAKGRSMPPDVSRMVTQMKAGKDKD
jgi:putative copper export protein